MEKERIKLVDMILKMDEMQFTEFIAQAENLLGAQEEKLSHPACP